jgi:hypothetical protein
MEIRRHYMGVSVSWEDLNDGAAPTDAAVIAGFVELNTEAVISQLFVLSWLLEDARPHSNTPAVQGAIADWLLPADLAQAARVRLAHPDIDAHREAVVHHEQLLAATALALVNGRPGSPEPGEPTLEQRHHLGSLLLKVSSLLGTGERVAPESDLILGATVRQAYVASNEQAALVAARNYEILIEGAQRAHQDGRLRYDLRSDFIAAYGIEPVAFMGIGLLHALPWIDLEALAQTPSAFWEAGRRLVADLARLGLDERLLQVLVADRGWFEQQLAVRSLRTFNMLLLYQCPVLRLTDGGLMPINWRLLLNRVYAGLFWAMHTAYLKQGGTDRLQDWMGQLGRILYQPYIDRRMQDIYNRSGAPPRYLSEDDVGRYLRGPKQREVDGADGYVINGQCIIVVEVTASAIPVLTMLSADGAAFRRDVQRLLIAGKLGQLNRVINDLIAGRLILPDVNIADITEIIPLLLTAGAFPQFPTVWSAVRDAWTAAQFFNSDARIIPPQLMTFEELELMQAALTDGSLSLREVLLGRETTYTGGSIKNYLASTGAELRPSQMTGKEFERFRGAVTEVMRGFGLPEN